MLCWQTDILRTSFKPKGAKAHFAPYSLVFFDPPYRWDRFEAGNAAEFHAAAAGPGQRDDLRRNSWSSECGSHHGPVPACCWEIDWTLQTRTWTYIFVEKQLRL